MSTRVDPSAPTRAVRIQVGESLPPLKTPLVSGGDLALPADLSDDWAVVLLYRGHWCPYCRQQLADFQRNLVRFADRKVRVAALSADPREEAATTVSKHGIEFPVGYALDPAYAAGALGCYLGGDDAFVQATGFVLRPGGRVELAVYSSGAVGRLVAADVLGLVEYVRQQETV